MKRVTSHEQKKCLSLRNLSNRVINFNHFKAKQIRRKMVKLYRFVQLLLLVKIHKRQNTMKLP